MMYRAPEMVDLYQRVLINEKVDVWSLGCILYTMAFCAHPFADGSQLSILGAVCQVPSDEYPEYVFTLAAS